MFLFNFLEASRKGVPSKLSDSQREVQDLVLCVLETRVVKRQITPGVIYEWCSERFKAGEEWRESGKGKLVLKEAKTNQAIFQAQINEWENGIPKGYVELRRISRFPSDSWGAVKVEEELLYAGDILRGKKHGRGKQTRIEKYKDNSQKVQILDGLWRDNQFVSPVEDRLPLKLLPPIESKRRHPSLVITSENEM